MSPLWTNRLLLHGQIRDPELVRRLAIRRVNIHFRRGFYDSGFCRFLA
jgi:hypothetical protein